MKEDNNSVNDEDKEIDNFIIETLKARKASLEHSITIRLNEIETILELKKYNTQKKHKKFRYVNTTPKLVELTPPKFAQFLLYLFVNKDNRDAILGDLEEEYRDVYSKFGLNKARVFYCLQVSRSLTPLISAWVLKLLKLFVQGIITKLSSSK